MESNVSVLLTYSNINCPVINEAVLSGICNFIAIGIPTALIVVQKTVIDLSW